MHRLSFMVPLVVVLGCAGSPEAAKAPVTDSAPAMAAAEAVPAVRLTAPIAGSTVSGGSVLVQFAAENIEIVPASGTQEPGKAHHHLFVDADVTPAGEVVPKTEQIYHLGNGLDTLTISGLAPGEHRLIAVLAWGTHVPVEGARQDTVRFTVQP